MTCKARPLVKVAEEREDYTFKSLFRVVRARLQFRRFDGGLSPPLTRISFERGNSVGVLLYDPEADSVVLVKQFRYPVYAGLPEEERHKETRVRQAWTLEIVAGVQEAGVTPQQVARNELHEETGHQTAATLHPIATIYPSPGGSSERIHIFWAEADSQDLKGALGGVPEAGEDTQVVVMPLQQALDQVRSGEICDAKTVIALQHLAILKKPSH